MVSPEMTGGAITEPADEPALNMPTPSARCFGANHSDTALVAAGQLPGSPSPSKKRAAANDQTPVQKACSMAANDQTPMKREKLFFVPSRSTTYPDPAYIIA